MIEEIGQRLFESNVPARVSSIKKFIKSNFDISSLKEKVEKEFVVKTLQMDELLDGVKVSEVCTVLSEEFKDVSGEAFLSVDYYGYSGEYEIEVKVKRIVDEAEDDTLKRVVDLVKPILNRKYKVLEAEKILKEEGRL